MIEMRIVDNGLGCRPEFQYRYHRLQYDWYKGKVNPPFQGADWSEWKTAPYVSLMETQND